MRFQALKSIAVVGICTLVLGGCGSKSVTPAAPSQMAAPQSGTRLLLSGAIPASGGPQMLAHVRRPFIDTRHRFAFTLKNVSVLATLFPGDAGHNLITNSAVIPVPVGAFSATVSLSNVPVHNNEWAMLQFVGNATDGSQVALGELTGLVNVASTTTNTATLSDTTSTTFQVALFMMQNGAISTNDLDSSATLASTLATNIAGTGVTPDPTTKLFTAGGLTRIYNTIEPKFAGNVTITPSPATTGTLFILRDYTNASELNLVSNLEQFAIGFAPAVQPPVIGDVIAGSAGSSSGGFNTSIPLHSPSTNPEPIPSLVSAYMTSGGAQTVRNVYRGHILVGATNNTFSSFPPPTPPFNGGFAAFAGHAPGSFSVTVPTALTQKTFAVSDPAGFAFGAAFYNTEPPNFSAFLAQPNFGTAPLSSTTFFSTVTGGGTEVMVPTPYSSTSNKIIAGTFNIWDIAIANMQICAGVTCWGLGTTAPPPIKRPFADAGTKLTFFNWKPTGTATTITQTPGGYSITISGPGTATLTTTTPSVLLARQRITISGGPGTPTTWTLTAKDALSNIYSNSGTSNFGSTIIDMDSVGQTVTTTQIVLSFNTVSAGTVAITSIR